MNYDPNDDRRHYEPMGRRNLQPPATDVSINGTGSSGEHVLNLGLSAVKRVVQSIPPVVMTDLKRPVGPITLATILAALALGGYLGVKYGEKGMCDCRTICEN